MGTRKMRGRRTRWLTGILSVLLSGAGIAVPAVEIGVAAPSVASATQQSEIFYYQQKGGGGSYIEYSGADGTILTQKLSSGGGGCSSPTVSSPVLAFSASYYPSGYSLPPTPASVGAYNLRTGVCAIAPDWQIQPNEGLIFSVGDNPLTVSQVFSQASIPLEREDKTAGPLSGTLVFRLKDTSGVEQVVATQTFTVGSGVGTVAVAQSGIVPSGFDQVEIQVDSPSSGAVSVVGPTTVNGTTVVPTFYLASAPAITSANSTTFDAGTPGSFTVTTTGVPTPSLNDNGFSGCTSSLPTGVSFTDNGNGTATLAGTPGPATGGTYTVCISATNIVSTATQVFTLTVNPEVCSGTTLGATQGSGSDVSATLTVTSGCKNYSAFVTAGNESSTEQTVDFATTGTQTFTATAQLNWGLLPYCVPNSSGGSSGQPICAPTMVTINGVTYPQTFCSQSSPPASGWCTTNVSYTYETVDGTLYTNIVEKWYGAGDPLFSR